MRLYALLALVVLTAGCATNGAPGSFGAKDGLMTDRTHIKLVLVDDPNVECHRRMPMMNQQWVYGCAEFEGEWCTLILPRDTFSADERKWNALIGHEVRHCFKGYYHR